MCRVILPNLLHRDGHKNESLYAATVLIGTNDAVLEDKDDRAVPLDEYKDNLLYIISKIESYGVPRERIILVTPPPMDSASWTKYAREKGKFIFTYRLTERRLRADCPRPRAERGPGNYNKVPALAITVFMTLLRAPSFFLRRKLSVGLIY